ncbi:malate:quinone oxidoreductase [Ensifer adhaerens]|uniref:malate:quinone oxidoreductase n=1 Tax=Ensifer adhaerens TaxID=106592 RepID=UPI001CBDA3D4|nr:malate:quinone oxidoreductase [Ensifer adhaerens]MBZ7922211.1 malate:quinone oxidoreductase [Ensifer adhaerens]UAX90857.1 malate:quinone oxidoreductase [Ensifer adhaerens]UAX98486.1 malate:quinone oxidoreductase [Ensifer adhaerens]UAY05867.1 malate:quinone oxidoreductase [Ensifer adhaerens]
MDAFLKIAGAVVVVVSLAIALQATVPSFGWLGIVLALQSAAPTIGAGIALAAFGSLLAQLKKIRLATERQADLFQSIVERRSQPAAE